MCQCVSKILLNTEFSISPTKTNLSVLIISCVSFEVIYFFLVVLKALHPVNFFSVMLVHFPGLNPYYAMECLVQGCNTVPLVRSYAQPLIKSPTL